MATERIDIVISERGGRRVKRTLDGLGKGASESDRALKLLKRTIGALGLGALARSVINTADAYTNMQNQIKLVTKGTAELDVVTQSLLESANRTRSSLEANSQLYVKTSRNAKRLGLSQKEVLDFTEQINQAVVLSGATAQEASAGVRQLGQAIGTGTLRGDELVSVLENTIEVAEVIAKGMGVTTGQLRKLGATGKITAQDIVRSFKEAREELAERFGRTIPTVAQSVQVMSNNWTNYIGEVNKSSGITATLASGLMVLSGNIDTVAKSILAVAITLGVTFAAQAIPAAIAGIKALTAAVIATGVGGIAIAILAVVSALAVFSDQIHVSSDDLITLADVGLAVWGLISDKASDMADFISDVFDDVLKFFNDTFGKAATVVSDLYDSMGIANTSWVRLIAKGLDLTLGSIVAWANLVVRTYLAIGKSAEDIFGSIAKFVTSGFDPSVFEGLGNRIGQSFVDGLNKSIASSKGITFFQDTLTGLAERSEAIALERQAREQATKRQRDAARAGLSVDPGAAERVATKFSDIRKDLEEEGRLLRLNIRDREVLANILDAEKKLKTGLLPTQKATVESLTRENQQLAVQAQELENILGPQRAFTEQMDALNALMLIQPDLIDEIREAMRQLQEDWDSLKVPTTFGDGFRLEVKKMIDAGQNATVELGKLFGGLFTKISAGFADATARAIVFGDDWQQSIKQTAQSILATLLSSLIQIGIQLAINAAISNSNPVAGAVSGGIQGVVGGIKSLASGGFTGNGGTSEVAGVVHGQEFVLNAAATKRIGRGNLESANRGGGMSGGGQMNVTVINQDIPGAEFEVRQLSVTDVEIIATRAVQKNAGNVIAQEMSNPSSKTSKAIGGFTTAQRRRS